MSFPCNIELHVNRRTSLMSNNLLAMPPLSCRHRHLVLDYQDEFMTGINELLLAVAEGQVKPFETTLIGLETAPEVVCVCVCS